MPETALIIGITGQDGAYLSALLLDNKCDVHGMRPYTPHDDCKHLGSAITMHYGDLSDTSSLIRLLEQIRPDTIYNLGAMSHVQHSFTMPEHTSNINALGVVRLLEAIRIVNPAIKLVQASSSEMFGNAPAPQNENTAFAPCSPYGTAKLFAYWSVINYRDAYGLHASNAIMFNHESPIRGEEFVTQKIIKAAKAIHTGEQECLYLGNLDAKRDWGHARDYMNGMIRIARHNTPIDLVLASGAVHSVRAFTTQVFGKLGHDIKWQGDGINETGIHTASGNAVIKIDESLFRPVDVNHLHGDAARAKELIGWEATTNLNDLIDEMLQ